MLVHRKALTKGKYIDNDKRKHPVVPIRFVRACRKGHIGDIDWYRFVHERNPQCRRQLWIDERGTSGDIADIFIRCDCGEAGPLMRATVAGVLGRCDGCRPWLGPCTKEGCDELSRLLVRHASNAYFPQIMSVISLPDRNESLEKAVTQVWENFLQYVDTIDELRKERQKKPPVKAALDGFTDEEVLQEIEVRKGVGDEAPIKSVKQAEFEGMQPQHLALLVETIVQTRSRQPQQADLVDLVWTGPETMGVTNRDTGVVVRDLFGTAESEVLVAGFAVYQGRTLFQRLAERMAERPGLKVRFFLDVHRRQDDTTLPSELLRQFAQHFRTHDRPGGRLPDIYYDPRSLETQTGKRSSLHAKCVVIDRRVAFVTSANFTEAAQTRNIEVGTLIRCEGFAGRLAVHFETLADVGVLRRLALDSTR